MLQGHHVIALSCSGPHIPENIIRLSPNDHSEIHQEQNISSGVIRHYRKKTNDTLIPSESSLMVKLMLWKEFFKNIGNVREESQIAQLWALAQVRQINEIRGPGMVSPSFVSPGRAREQAETLLEGIIRAQLAIIRSKTR